MSLNINLLSLKRIVPTNIVMAVSVEINKPTINHGIDTRYDTSEIVLDSSNFNYLLSVQNNIDFLTNKHIHVNSRIDTAYSVLKMLNDCSYSISSANIRNGGLLDNWS